MPPTSPSTFTNPGNKKPPKVVLGLFYNKLNSKRPMSTRKALTGVSLVAVVIVGISSIVMGQVFINRKTFNDSQAAVEDVKIAKDLEDKVVKDGKVKVLITLQHTPKGLEKKLTKEEEDTEKAQIKTKQKDVETNLEGIPTVIKYQYDNFPMIAAEVNPQALAKLKTLKGVVTSVVEDSFTEPHLAESGPLTGAPVAYATGSGYDGRGSVIVIIDTGVDKTHAFLKHADGRNKVIAEACFSQGQCPNGQFSQIGEGAGAPCIYYDSATASTPCGHGTLVAGMAAGGTSSGFNTVLNGIAKGADIIAINTSTLNAENKIVNYASDILMALDWTYLQKDTYGIDVVNISSGAGSYAQSCEAATDNNGPLYNTAAGMFTLAGIPIVASTGNEGTVNGIGSPACVSYFLAVGSHNLAANNVSSFSNISPFKANTFLAPGEEVNSSGFPGSWYLASSGTSNAAPMVAGAIAILKQAKPTATWTELVDVLTRGSTPITDTRAGAPAGATYKKLDIGRSVNLILGNNADATGTTTAFAADDNTTMATWSHTNNVLGVSTDSEESEGEVLQSASGYGNVMLVTAAYRAKLNPAAKLISVTYCGQTMTHLKRSRSINQTTEMWYLKNPPGGTCQIQARFDVNPEERVFSSTILKSVDLIGVPVVSPLQTAAGTGTHYGDSFGLIRSEDNSAFDSIHTCVYSTFPEGTANIVNNSEPKENKWTYRGKNIATGLGVAVKRMATDSSYRNILKWTPTFDMPNALSCATFKLNPGAATASTRSAPDNTFSYPLFPSGVGRNGSYYNNSDFTALAYSDQTTANTIALNYNWGTGSPDNTRVPGDTFSVRWTGFISPQYNGEHTFQIRANDGVRLWIDDRLIIDRWTNYAGTDIGPIATGKATLTLGRRSKYVLEFYENTGTAGIQLSWSHPNLDMSLIPYRNFFITATGTSTPPPTPIVTPSPTPRPVTPSPSPTPPPTPRPAGLLGQYFDNMDFTLLKTSRYDPAINFGWSTNSPATGVAANTFSVRWSGFVRPPVTGVYTFTTRSDEGMRLWVNNQLVVNHWAAHTSVQDRSGTISLTANQYYAIRVEHFDNSGDAVARLLWKYPGQVLQVIPATRLFH